MGKMTSSNRERKFIVYKEDGEYILRLGYVFMHTELLNRNESWNDCCGGGYWKLSDDGKTIELYGRSADFGKVRKDILQKAIDTTNPASWTGLAKKVYNTDNISIFAITN